MRLMSVSESRYHYLPDEIKLKRAKMFVKLATLLELGQLDDPDKIWNYLDSHMIEDDLEYMTIEELILMRSKGFVDDSKIYDLFPEEFDYLDGIPVLMWDVL
jgi:hypothetical protein